MRISQKKGEGRGRASGEERIAGGWSREEFPWCVYNKMFSPFRGVGHGASGLQGT